MDNTAPAQAAGYILQLDRALYHLAHASAGDIAVAVEHVDDIAVVRDGKIILLEQDKSTTRSGTRLLGDRTRAIWRTLQIWLRHAETDNGAQCQRYLFFVNRWVPSPIAQLIKDRHSGRATVADIVGGLRTIGSKRTTAKVQTLIDDVLTRSDASLATLLGKVELVEATNTAVDRKAIANGLGLNPRADTNDILDSLFGWLTNRVRLEWSEGRPGLITRDEVLVQSHVLQAKQAKRRFLPRASGEIHIEDNLRRGQLSRNFVEHLSRIDAESEDIVQAVDHFLKFNIEKHRLVRAGDVPDLEWSHRSDRLRERWAGLMRRRRRELKGKPNCDIGQTVLADVTYDHRETLDGHPCEELYMTSGHYHRLAEEDEVWWDPTFRKAGQDEG